MLASLAPSDNSDQKRDPDHALDQVESHCVTPLSLISAALLGRVFPDEPGAAGSDVRVPLDFAVIASDLNGSITGLVLEVAEND